MDMGRAFYNESSRGRRSPRDEIYLIDADGSHEIRLTSHPRADRSPTWSPDGDRMVFDSGRDGNQEISSIATDGSGLTRVTTSSAADTGPAWGLRRAGG